MAHSQSPVTWENPPPERGSRYDWAAIAEQLKSRPGEWAKIVDHDRYSLATSIRIASDQHPLNRAKEFELRTSNNRFDSTGTRVCTLHMRALPEEPKPSKKKGGK